MTLPAEDGQLEIFLLITLLLEETPLHFVGLHGRQPPLKG